MAMKSRLHIPSRTESNGNRKQLHFLKVKWEIDHFNFFINFKIILCYSNQSDRSKDAFKRLWMIILPELSSAERFLYLWGHSIARNGRLISVNPMATGLISMPSVSSAQSLISDWGYRKEVCLCSDHAKKKERPFSHCIFFKSFRSGWTGAFLTCVLDSLVFSSSLSPVHALFQTMPSTFILGFWMLPPSQLRNLFVSIGNIHFWIQYYIS